MTFGLITADRAATERHQKDSPTVLGSYQR